MFRHRCTGATDREVRSQHDSVLVRVGVEEAILVLVRVGMEEAILQYWSEWGWRRLYLYWSEWGWRRLYMASVGSTDLRNLVALSTTSSHTDDTVPSSNRVASGRARRASRDSWSSSLHRSASSPAGDHRTVRGISSG